jgi:Fe-S oxidoreductase
MPLQERRADWSVVVKTTRITIETENLLVVRKGKTIITWCPACCADVEVMMLEGVSPDKDLPSSYLTDWLATGKLHLWHPAEGSAQICLPSLLLCFEAESVPRLGNSKTDSKTGDEQ